MRPFANRSKAWRFENGCTPLARLPHQLNIGKACRLTELVAEAAKNRLSDCKETFVAAQRE